MELSGSVVNCPRGRKIQQCRKRLQIACDCEMNNAETYVTNNARKVVVYFLEIVATNGFKNMSIL